MELAVHSFANGEAAGNVDLSDDVFARDYNEALIHQVLTAFFAGARRGTKGNKSRSAVSGGGAKPFRQKGLGRARAGTIRSPLWRGGGVTFAAKPRSYAQKVNRKMYRSALRSILSELVRQGRLVAVESTEMSEPKTKALLASLKNFDVNDVLIIAEDVTENLYLSARNLHWVGLVDVSMVDPAMLVAYNKVVISKAALASLEEQLK